MFAWKDASPVVNSLIKWRNQRAHPLPHNSDYGQEEQDAFYDALQVLEDEKVLGRAESHAIKRFVQTAHHVTRPERGGSFKAKMPRNQASLDPFAGTDNPQQPKKM